eukprot:g1553.t1
MFGAAAADYLQYQASLNVSGVAGIARTTNPVWILKTNKVSAFYCDITDPQAVDATSAAAAAAAPAAATTAAAAAADSSSQGAAAFTRQLDLRSAQWGPLERATTNYTVRRNYTVQVGNDTLVLEDLETVTTLAYTAVAHLNGTLVQFGVEMAPSPRTADMLGGHAAQLGPAMPRVTLLVKDFDGLNTFPAGPTGARPGAAGVPAPPGQTLVPHAAAASFSSGSSGGAIGQVPQEHRHLAVNATVFMYNVISGNSRVLPRLVEVQEKFPPGEGGDYGGRWSTFQPYDRLYKPGLPRDASTVSGHAADQTRYEWRQRGGAATDRTALGDLGTAAHMDVCETVSTVDYFPCEGKFIVRKPRAVRSSERIGSCHLTTTRTVDVYYSAHVIRYMHAMRASDSKSLMIDPRLGLAQPINVTTVWEPVYLDRISPYPMWLYIVDVGWVVIWQIVFYAAGMAIVMRLDELERRRRRHAPLLKGRILDLVDLLGRGKDGNAHMEEEDRSVPETKALFKVLPYPQGQRRLLIDIQEKREKLAELVKVDESEEESSSDSSNLDWDEADDEQKEAPRAVAALDDQEGEGDEVKDDRGGGETSGDASTPSKEPKESPKDAKVAPEDDSPQDKPKTKKNKNSGDSDSGSEEGSSSDSDRERKKKKSGKSKEAKGDPLSNPNEGGAGGGGSKKKKDDSESSSASDTDGGDKERKGEARTRGSTAGQPKRRGAKANDESLKLKQNPRRLARTRTMLHVAAAEDPFKTPRPPPFSRNCKQDTLAQIIEEYQDWLDVQEPSFTKPKSFWQRCHDAVIANHSVLSVVIHKYSGQSRAHRLNVLMLSLSVQIFVHTLAFDSAFGAVSDHILDICLEDIPRMQLSAWGGGLLLCYTFMVALITVPLIQVIGNLYAKADWAQNNLDFFASLWNARKCHFRKKEKWNPPKRLLPASVELQEMRGARLALLVRIDRVRTFCKERLRALPTKLAAQRLRQRKDAAFVEAGLRGELAVAEERIWRLEQNARALTFREKMIRASGRTRKYKVKAGSRLNRREQQLTECERRLHEAEDNAKQLKHLIEAIQTQVDSYDSTLALAETTHERAMAKATKEGLDDSFEEWPTIDLSDLKRMPPRHILIEHATRRAQEMHKWELVCKNEKERSKQLRGLVRVVHDAEVSKHFYGKEDELQTHTQDRDEYFLRIEELDCLSRTLYDNYIRSRDPCDLPASPNLVVLPHVVVACCFLVFSAASIGYSVSFGPEMQQAWAMCFFCGSLPFGLFFVEPGTALVLRLALPEWGIRLIKQAGIGLRPPRDASELKKEKLATKAKSAWGNLKFASKFKTPGKDAAGGGRLGNEPEVKPKKSKGGKKDETKDDDAGGLHKLKSGFKAGKKLGAGPASPKRIAEFLEPLPKPSVEWAGKKPEDKTVKRGTTTILGLPAPITWFLWIRLASGTS